MKKTVVLDLFFLIVVVGLSLQACSSARQDQTPTPNIPISPTEQPLFSDNNMIKNIFEEHPLSVCSVTSDGWECYRDIAETGRWYLRYYSASTGANEVYESEYIDFSGLNRDAIIEVLAGTTAIVPDEVTSNAIMDWVVDEGIGSALAENKEVTSTKVHDVYVFLSLTK